MVQNFKELLQRALRKKDTAMAHIEDEIMVINCLECGFTPEPGTRECMRCMVNNMSELGGTDRIILRTGRDLEISGNSGRIIRDISSLRRWSIPFNEEERQCRRCNCSRKEVMTDLWDGFPEMNFVEAYNRLDQDGRNQECSDCIRGSIRALEQLESDLESIRKSLIGC